MRDLLLRFGLFSKGEVIGYSMKTLFIEVVGSHSDCKTLYKITCRTTYKIIEIDLSFKNNDEIIVKFVICISKIATQFIQRLVK